MVTCRFVLLFYGFIKIAFCAIGNANAVRLYDDAEILHALAVMLQINFIRMQFQFIFHFELFPDKGNASLQVFLIGMNKNNIVNISSVITYRQVALYKMIEFIQIDIAEKLRCEIADGQTTIFVRMEQTFCFRQLIPVAFLSFYDTICCGVVKYCFFDKLKDKRQAAANPVLLPSQFSFYFLEKHDLIHRHEISLDVELEDVTIFGIILRTGTDEVIYSLNAVMCAFSFAAAITVIDKGFFKYAGDAIVNVMMHHPVFEIRCEYFTLHRFVDDETDAWLWFVSMRYDLVV